MYWKFIDIMGEDNRYVLTIMDDTTRFLKTVDIPSLQTGTILQAFIDHWVSIFGIPKEVVSDRAKQLIGPEIIISGRRNVKSNCGLFTRG